jgi:probable HAF family extracellular repeat protein
MVDLGVLGGVHSGAHAINNRGQVVGNSNNGTVANRAFLWTPGATDGVSTNPQMKDLGTLGGPTSQVYDINDGGVAVGVADTAQTSKGNPIWHAYRWIPNSPNATTGRMESLGFSSVAEGINNLGEIVGGTQTGGSFRWVEGVGREVLPEVYTAYAVQDVDPMLNPGAGGKIVGVKSIVGADGLNYSRAYLLTPDLPTADSPAAPASLSAPSKTTTSVTLAWNYTGTAPTAGFRVDYKGPNGSWVRSTSTVSRTASGYTVTVSGLTSGTLYYFRVRAENAVAAGKTISHFVVTSATTASSTKTR